MSLLGAIAGPLIGGLFGRKKQSTTTRVDYNHIRNAAAAAGFNPLTALRNGGSANATTTGPSLASGNFIGEALSRGIDTWFNRDQIARDQEMDRINLELAREELTAVRSRNAYLQGAGAGYDVQNITGQVPALHGGNPTSAAQADNGGNLITNYTDTDGSTVPLPNPESGLEVSEIFGTTQAYNDNPQHWNRQFGTALWNASPFLAGGLASYAAYRNRGAIGRGVAQGVRSATGAIQTRNNVRAQTRGSGGGGGSAFRVPGQNRRGPYYPPLFNFF